jgi:hypothetical protein
MPLEWIGTNFIEEEPEKFTLLFPLAILESKDVFNEPLLAYFIAWYFYHGLQL